MPKGILRYAVLLAFCVQCLPVQSQAPVFHVIAFFSHNEDQGHKSFVHEANRWFPEMASLHHFTYDSTNDWRNLNDNFLSHYQLIIFLDSRPDSLPQREAFQRFMERGGAWMGFHFAAFALTPSAFPQNWDWYHEKFIGAGEWKGNTWRPTSAILRMENRTEPYARNMPDTFKASPNEWYKWTNDLRRNPDIKIIASIDSSSFPLGTGPKLYEIWHSGYYPVVWTNTRYRMIYFNMGHNDIDYDHGNRDLSHTFGNPWQDKLILEALIWLGGHTK